MRLFQRWLEERELLLAKLELSMEASRDPELAELLAGYRSRLVERGRRHHGRAATASTAHERAETLVASFDGILLAALLQAAGHAGRAFLERSLALLMRSLAGPAAG